MAVNIHEVVDKLNTYWTNSVKLIVKDACVSRIVYDHVLLAGLFLSFKDKEGNLIGTVRIAAIDKYDSKDNSITLK